MDFFWWSEWEGEIFQPQAKHPILLSPPPAQHDEVHLPRPCFHGSLQWKCGGAEVNGPQASWGRFVASEPKPHDVGPADWSRCWRRSRWWFWRRNQWPFCRRSCCQFFGTRDVSWWQRTSSIEVHLGRGLQGNPQRSRWRAAEGVLMQDGYCRQGWRLHLLSAVVLRGASWIPLRWHHQPARAWAKLIASFGQSWRRIKRRIKFGTAWLQLDRRLRMSVVSWKSGVEIWRLASTLISFQ